MNEADILAECGAHATTTDSLGSRSDNSGKTSTVNQAAGSHGSHGSHDLAGKQHLLSSSSQQHLQQQKQRKPQMEVVCVIDHHFPKHLAARKAAFEEVKLACAVVTAGQQNVQHIQFER